jgi:hypothetical protein
VPASYRFKINDLHIVNCGNCGFQPTSACLGKHGACSRSSLSGKTRKVDRDSAGDWKTERITEESAKPASANSAIEAPSEASFQNTRRVACNRLHDIEQRLAKWPLISSIEPVRTILSQFQIPGVYAVQKNLRLFESAKCYFDHRAVANRHATASHLLSFLT